MVSDETRAFIDALDDLEVALEENVKRAARMRERIAELREAFDAGRRLHEVVPEAEAPPIVRLLSDSARVFDQYGSRVRRTEARALYGEGLTMDQIARLFGVSRQRISALLRDPPPSRD